MGHRHGYARVSLKEREEPRLKRANQVEKMSTGVDALALKALTPESFIVEKKP